MSYADSPRKRARPCSPAIDSMRNPALKAPNSTSKFPTREVGHSGRIPDGLPLAEPHTYLGIVGADAEARETRDGLNVPRSKRG